MTGRLRRGLAVCLLLLGAGLVVGPLAAQGADPVRPPASPLSECDRLKAENLKLRAQLLDAQRTIAQAQIDRETSAIDADRQALETTFRALLKPAPGETFNWSTLTFGPPASPTPAAPPAVHP